MSTLWKKEYKNDIDNICFMNLEENKNKVNSFSNYNELKIAIEESYLDPKKLGQIITL